MKKKGPEIRKPTDLKYKSEVKHLLGSRLKDLENQELKLFMKFADTYPPADSMPTVADGILSFLTFLKNSGYHIINGQTVFCFPFNRMVKLKDLKQGGE